MTTLHSEKKEERRLARVRFRLAENDWHGVGSERLWAEELSPGKFKLRNSPFYARGVSLADVVSTTWAADGGNDFVAAVARGGHSTYRIFAKHDVESSDFLETWRLLERIGCTFEKATGHLIAVDVPATTDIHETYRLLQLGEERGAWEFEEGHCGHLRA